MNNTSSLEVLLKNYHPSQSAIDTVKTTPLLLLVGISGAGKGTIRKRLLDTGRYIDFISHTTRKPRENNGVMEQDGVEYHFISTDTAIHMLERGEFIEAKYYGGNIYGTSTAELMKARTSGKVALNDIEVQGVSEYFNISSSVKVIFIVPPSYTVWLRRLVARYDGHIDHTTLSSRVETAKNELTTALDDQRFLFVVNDSLDLAIEDIEHIVMNKPYNDKPARTIAQTILNYLHTTDWESASGDIARSVIS